MHNEIISLPPGCAEIAKAAQLKLKIFVPEHASKRDISRLSLLLDESISPIAWDLIPYFDDHQNQYKVVAWHQPTGKAAAYLSFHFEVDSPESVVHKLNFIVVSSAFRGKKISSLLLDFCLFFLQEKQLSKSYEKNAHFKSILQDSSDTRTSLELEKKLNPKKSATFLYERRGYSLSPISSIDEDAPEYELILPARDDLHTKRGYLKRRWSI